MSNLKIARVCDHDLANPQPESDGAAALDIRTAEDIILYPGEEKLVGTGFAYEPRPSTAHIKRRKAPEKSPPKEPEHEEVDLTDMAEADDEAEEEPAPPVRSRRRRIVRD